MNQFSIRDRKNKHPPTSLAGVQYLALSSEPKEVTAASRGSFGYHNRYLAKRRLMRAVRRLRHGQVN